MAHPRYLWEVTIAPSNDDLDFTDGTGAHTAALTNADYYIRGGGVAVSDLLQQLKTKLDAAGGQVYTVVRSSAGFVTISAPGNFSLHWNTGAAATVALANVLGFSTAADDAGQSTYTGDFQHRFGWYPEKHLLDGKRRLEDAVAGGVRSMGKQQYVQQWSTDYRAVARIDFVPGTKVRYADVDGTAPNPINQAFTSNGQAAWDGFYDAARRGTRFEFHPDESIIAALTGVIDPAETDWFEDLETAAEILMEAGEKYRILVPMRPYQA